MDSTTPAFDPESRWCTPSASPANTSEFNAPENSREARPQQRDLPLGRLQSLLDPNPPPQQPEHPRQQQLRRIRGNVHRFNPRARIALNSFLYFAADSAGRVPALFNKRESAATVCKYSATAAFGVPIRNTNRTAGCLAS